MQTQLSPACRAKLEKVVAAHQALQSFSCQITMVSKGIARPSGSVQLAFLRPGRIRLEVRSSEPGSVPELMVCDGTYFYRTQPKRRVFVKSPVPAGGDALKAAFLTANPLPLPIFSWLLTEPKPLEKLLSAEIVSVKELAEEQASGVAMERFAFASKPGRGESVLAFGKADGLLRRATVTVIRPDKSRVEIVENYTKVEANPKLSESHWVFISPAGYRDSAAPRPPLPPAPDLGPKAIKTASGLQYLDLKLGAGAVVKAGSTVTVHYVGSLTNGEEFDSSYEAKQPFEFQVPGQVIPGWNEGILGMKVGGKRRLVIPPALGYGAQANGPIPADATLLFDIELLSVKG